MKNTLLYFGSFNPTHNGHISLAEYAVEHGLCDEAILVVSPQNPLKECNAQAPEMNRFEMAEIACAASRYPEKIKPSVVEFLLDKPSYTIHTLRHLTENYGSQMRFSILMGADNLAQLDRWKEYTEILDNYPIYVYPRWGLMPDKFLDRVHYLTDAPLRDFSSTEVREAALRGDAIDTMVCSEVADYIRTKELWTPAQHLEALTLRLEAEGQTIDLLIERGKLHYRLGEWGKALNDFRAVLRLDDTHAEAHQYIDMAEDILAFRYKDIYNP